MASLVAATALTHAAARFPNLRRLTHAMANLRFVSYQPTANRVANGKVSDADEASIRADLATLRPFFDALVTYSSRNGADRVADVAVALGFRAVVMGIWDPFDQSEVDNALAAAKRNGAIVVGLSVGNEMVFSKRADWRDISTALRLIRERAPTLPLSTSEPFAKYLDEPQSKLALAQMDFMLVNIHPIFESWFRSGSAQNWTRFVASVLARLENAFAGPVLVKETGVPSGPRTAGFDEGMQHDFWRALESRVKQSKRHAFSYFTAFDSPWRAYDATPDPGSHLEEAHWGLFTAQRTPKLVMNDFPKLHN